MWLIGVGNSKRIEGQISTLHEKSEQKRMEVSDGTYDLSRMAIDVYQQIYQFQMQFQQQNESSGQGQQQAQAV